MIKILNNTLMKNEMLFSPMIAERSNMNDFQLDKNIVYSFFIFQLKP